jgi:hypothetical protein
MPNGLDVMVIFLAVLVGWGVVQFLIAKGS